MLYGAFSVLVVAAMVGIVITQSDSSTFTLPLCKYLLKRYDPSMKDVIDQKIQALDEDCKNTVESVRKEALPILDNYAQGAMFDEATQNKTCDDLKEIMDKSNNSMECITKLSKSKK